MNKLLRLMLTVSFFVFSHFLFAQTENKILVASPLVGDSVITDTVVNVPELSKQPYYKEHTTFDKQFVFTHAVSYNRPGVVDEEYTYTFEFTFTDFSKVKSGQVFDLAKDTALVHCNYGILSAWSWDFDAKAVIRGTLTIISKTKDEVVIEEAVRIRDRNGKIMIYKERKTVMPRKEK